MQMPFSRPEFLQVFSAYNQGIWPLQPLAAALGVLAIALLFSRSRGAHRSIAAILGVFWGITGIGYHWMYFSRINPAAWLFGALFVLAALIFLVEGATRDRIRFRVTHGLSFWLALLLIVYSLVVYPLLGLLVMQPYPETPLFGVAPCPTTIFTLGLLMFASYPRPVVLAAIPVLWAFIGGSAAIWLQVPQDWGLFVGVVFWFAVWIRRRKRHGAPA